MENFYLAKEFINRSAGGNQVLSLNVSNLFILVLLKALIFAAGMVGAGNWSQYGRGRSVEDSKAISNKSNQFPNKKMSKLNRLDLRQQ